MRLLALAAALTFAAGAASAVTITDSRGPQDFSDMPERVIPLEWSLVEQVVELGVTPVAVADPEGYRTWVGAPDLPEGVADAGLRQEPNLERIAELDPDVILVADDQITMVPTLERIAPVLHFDTFSEEHNNAEAARETFLDLARLFGREEIAREKLAARDARIAELAAEIDAHFEGDPPKVSVVRFSDEARVRLYGANSMPVYALEALGLESGIDQPPSKWGLSTRKVEELGELAEGIVLHIEPFPQGEDLFTRPLWQAMPFVREGRFGALPPSWTYGGAMSIGYLAEAVAEALLARPQ